MYEYPLVSIITSCYNGEKYVSRFLESVLNQTYNNIELVFVNDGSTDATSKIVLSYESKIKEHGYNFKYIYQKNGGVASAINTGLNSITGKYLTWPDSDDWMSNDCIEKKVSALETHPEWGLVCCRSAIVREEAPSVIVGIMERKSKDSLNFFDDLIAEKDVYFAPGGYMVRVSYLFSVLRNRQIFNSKAGQNWQMLLPLAKKFECGFLDDILFYYVVRMDSHSHSVQKPIDLINRTGDHQEILYETIKQIDMELDEKIKNFEKINNRYSNKRYRIFSNIKNIDELKLNYKNIKEKKFNTVRIKLYYWKKVNKPIYFFLRIYYLLKNALLK